MNQILSTDMPINDKQTKVKKTNNIDKNILIKIFGIAILVVGVIIIGIGAFNIIKNKKGQVQNQSVEPTISIENKTDTSILLKVMHKKNIAKVQYRWNEEETIVINGNGKYAEQEINIPPGNNTLYVLVQDEDGNESTYEKKYESKSNINLQVEGNKIKIKYNQNKIVSYMTYRWDDGEEQKIEINNANVEQEIEAIKGMHTLTVIVVDEDNKTDTKVQKINGVSKPKLGIELDETREHFVIKASDDEKISRIEFTLNQDDGQTYLLNFENQDIKEINFQLPMALENGENTIEVKVYNSSNITEQSAAKYTK